VVPAEEDTVEASEVGDDEDVEDDELEVRTLEVGEPPYPTHVSKCYLVVPARQIRRSSTAHIFLPCVVDVEISVEEVVVDGGGGGGYP
jgi:hypothetical protein